MDSAKLLDIAYSGCRGCVARFDITQPFLTVSESPEIYSRCLLTFHRKPILWRCWNICEALSNGDRKLFSERKSLKEFRFLERNALRDCSHTRETRNLSRRSPRCKFDQSKEKFTGAGSKRIPEFQSPTPILCNTSLRNLDYFARHSLRWVYVGRTRLMYVNGLASSASNVTVR